MASMVLIMGSTCLIASLVPSAEVQAQSDSTSKFHHQKTSPKVDYQALLEGATPLSESSDGRQLLDSCFEAYGGVEKLKTLESFQLTYPLGPGGETEQDAGKIMKFFGPHRRYKVIEGDKERIINGDRCWVQDADQTWEMDDFRYRAELYSYLVLGMPLVAETESFDEVRFSEGKEEDLGLFYFVKTDSLMIILGVDKEDHLIKSTTGVLPAGEKTLVFVNKFDNFRTVDGFLFPHKLTNYSLGMKMGELDLEKMSVNPEFSESVFLPRSGHE
jgi:hypothetical protein